jgi:hypothetical protein
MSLTEYFRPGVLVAQHSLRGIAFYNLILEVYAIDEISKIVKTLVLRDNMSSGVYKEIWYLSDYVIYRVDSIVVCAHESTITHYGYLSLSC